MFVFVCVWICVYVCVCILSVCECVYMCVYVCMFVFIYVCVFVCVLVCACVWMHARVCVSRAHSVAANGSSILEGSNCQWMRSICDTSLAEGRQKNSKFGPIQLNLKDNIY